MTVYRRQRRRAQPGSARYVDIRSLAASKLLQRLQHKKGRRSYALCGPHLLFVLDATAYFSGATVSTRPSFQLTRSDRMSALESKRALSLGSAFQTPPTTADAGLSLLSNSKCL